MIARPILCLMTLLWGSAAAPLFAMDNDDPVMAMIKADQFEWRDSGDGDTVIIDGDAWLGTTLNKLWLKAHLARKDGATEDGELQLLYSRGIAPFWDLQAGLRHDTGSAPDRTWATIGFHGLAPGFVEADVGFFVSEGGQTALRLEAEYELLLTQRAVLIPEIEVTAHGRTLEAHGEGAGLAGVEAGLRLAYQVRREFAPYVGVHWSRRYGATADLHTRDGDDGKWHWAVGVRFWY